MVRGKDSLMQLYCNCSHFNANATSIPAVNEWRLEGWIV